MRTLAKRTLSALDRMTDLAEQTKAVKSARRALSERGVPSEKMRARLDEIRHELQDIVSEGKAPAPKRAKKPEPPHMPTEIHTKSGGKRVPSAVARRAVKRSTDEVVVKKGQKKKH